MKIFTQDECPNQGHPGMTVCALCSFTTTLGGVHDGHHTFDELYNYRMLYNAHAAHGWLAAGIPVVKSWRHSDGEECFGGGWFIVTAELPTGQVSNHYREQYWDLFQVPDEEVAPEYDGHTPAIAANRLRSYLEGQHMPQEHVTMPLFSKRRRLAERAWASYRSESSPLTVPAWFEAGFTFGLKEAHGG